MFSADLPAIQAEAHAPDWQVPVYVAATAPQMQQLGGEIGDGLLTPSITTPAFVRYTRENVAAGAAKAGRDGGDVDVGCTIVASIHATDRDAGRDGAREIAGMYLANKFQNIKGSADTLLDLAEIRHGGAPAGRRGNGARRPPRREGPGDRLAARPLQADRRHARRLHRRDRGVPRRGCSHIMLELWGANRHEQIRLFGEQVVPHFQE